MPMSRSCIGILPLQTSGTRSSCTTRCPASACPDGSASACTRRGPPAGRRRRLASELLLEARNEVDGVYLMPSFGRYEQILDVVRAARQEVS